MVKHFLLILKIEECAKYVIQVHENINKCTKKQENVNVYRQRKEDVIYGL